MKTAIVVTVMMWAAWSAGAQEVVFPGERWEEVVPEHEGMDGEKLRRAIEGLEKGVGKDGVKGLVIVRRGRIVWKGSDAEKVHGVWSVTKSFTSTVLGLLVDDGKVTLDTPAAQFVPELGEKFSKVTLRRFATMTSGYRAVGDEPKGTYTHGPSSTWFEPGEPLFAPGEKYAYWDSAMNEFGLVLSRVAGEPMEEVFRRRVAGPIGMTSWSWGRFGKVKGEIVINGGSGNSNKHVQLSAMDLARFGHLYLNKGKWKDRQVLSEQWVAEATKVQVPAALPLGHRESNIDGRGVYGLNWWVNGVKPDGRREWPSAPAGTFAASGFNNNKCFVVPEWEMVIVRMGLDGNVEAEVWGEFLGGVGEAVGATR